MPAELKPVYLLVGPDEFRRQQARADILRRAVGEPTPDLAVVTFEDEDDSELSAVLDELRTAPFLCERRVVVLRAADRFVLAHAGALARYLASPARTGILLLMLQDWPPAKPRRKGEQDDPAPEKAVDKEELKALEARVARVGELVDCASPSANQLPAFIAAAAQRRQKTLTPEAAELLAEWVGSDLARLESELEKLSLYVGDRPRITPEDVAAQVTSSASAEPFALVNAIRDRNPRKALSVLAAEMTKRGDENKLLGLLAWYLRDRLAKKQGEPRKLRGQMRLALQADLAMKSGGDPVTTMQLLVTRLCG